MEKNNQKRSGFESSKNTFSGYTIEIGNTTYENTLEERIQAAINASSSAKRTQQKYIDEKLSYDRNVNVQNMTVKNSMSSAQEFIIKSKQLVSINKTDVQTSTHVPLPKTITKTKNINSNFESKCNTNWSKPSYKGGGSMQLRLEAIKANKKLSNKISHECNSNLESNNPLKNESLQDVPSIKNYSSKLCNTNISKRSEYNTRSTVQKHPLEEVKYSGHCDRTKDITYTPCKSITSVQNRLIRAREKMTAKSKDNYDFNDSKNGITTKLPTCESGSIRHDTNTLNHNIKNKTKRLNQPNQSLKKKKPGLVSTTKKIVLNNNISVYKRMDQQLMNVQQKSIVPILNNMIPSSSSSVSETIVSTKLGNQCILNNSKSKELDSFSFVRPQTSWNQQTLEHKKNTQFNNDESMEWEDIETDNIVEKVNDLRRAKHEYEPMEWTPDAIMHSDRINYCLVIDTNILLSDLKSLTIVIDKYLTDVGYPTIVLPWQVLKELDCIKKSESALGYRAREATRWLLQMLLKRHPRLKGQPMTNKNGLNSDDDILKCAITVKKRVNIVYLVTDDNILSIKSEFNGISVKNSMWLQSVVTNTNQNNSKIFQEAVKNYPIIENKSIMKFEPHLEHIILKVLRYAVGLNMNYSVHTQKLWWEVYSLSKPFNLTQLLVKLKEHWNIVAPPDQLLKAPKKQLDYMEYFFDDLKKISPAISLSWIEFYNFLKYCTETIIALPYEYYHITDVLLNDLMKARRSLKQKLDCTTLGNESIYMLSNLSISNNNAQHNINIDNILHNVSKSVNLFCSYIYDDNGFKRDWSENELKCGVPKTINVDEKIKDYCSKLSNIIKIMLKIKLLKTEQILESHVIIDAFLKAITEMNNDSVNLNKENVTDYCLLKDKNSFFHILISFQNNLAAMKNLITSIKS